MPNHYLDTAPIRAAMKRRGLESEGLLCRQLHLDGWKVSPSTVHALLTTKRYNPRIAFVQAVCGTLRLRFEAPVDAEGRPDIARIEAAMRRQGLGSLDLWREMIADGYEGSFSSVRHVLSQRADSPRVATMAALCEALNLPLRAPIKR